VLRTKVFGAVRLTIINNFLTNLQKNCLILRGLKMVNRMVVV
jgi:hypothetical protein